jgi:RHS repeat-associated protein
MNRQYRVLFTHGLALIVGVSLLTAVALSQDSRPKLSPTASMTGQTVTLLPDATELLAGGVGPYGPTDTAAISDRGYVTPLASRLVTARAWHSAAVASDGSVVIIGGIGSDGKPVAAAERFDPETGTFSVLNATGLTPRSHHSATLLTDGTVLIVGGISEDGTTIGAAQLWNPRTNAATATTSALHIPRSGHTATLQANGAVLITGGVDAAGNEVRSSEVYDPTSQSFSLVKDNKTRNASKSTPEVSGSIPDAGAQNVPVSTTVSIRFSEPVDVTSVNPDTITLSRSGEDVAAHVVAAEGGRLAFVNPDSPLAPGTAYTVTVDGVSGTNGIMVPATSFSFTTAAASLVGSPTPPTSTTPGSGAQDNWLTDPEAWIPGSYGDWNTNRPPSPWQSLPAYRAKSGVTALSGQVLTLDGMPLAGVTLEVGKKRTTTDESGRFLLTHLQSGYVVLLIDGTSANHHGRTYGIFQTGVNLEARRTTVLSFTIWMPLLDTLHAVTIPSPTTSAMVITNPLMPGLELHIPAGTKITDINGKVVRTISITPIPLDRTPFPLPAGVQVPIYFTIQPGGAQLWTPQGTWALAQLYYPNPSHFGAGTQFDFWNYDASHMGWYVYGKGSVNQAGTEVVPDPGVGIWTFTGAMVGSPGEPPTTGDSQGDAADPVDTSTGIFRHSETDLRLADIIPIDFTRTYLSQDPTSRPFGTGFTDNYEIYITNNGAPNYTAVDIVLPDGEKVHYLNTGNQSDYTQANYVPTLTSAPFFYGSTITWNNSNNDGWLLTLKNGTVYSFPANGLFPAASALIGITDRYGNALTITRDSNGNITQITSPNGRWVQFTIDSNNRITQAADDLGRTVTYTYDTCGSGFLCSVTDANGGTTSYSYYTSGSPPPSGYGGMGNMSTIVDPRGNTEITELYDTNGRGATQTLPDGSTFQLAFTLNGNVVQQVSITDPNGNVEQKSFDTNGFVTSDSYAVGTSYEETTTYIRDPNSELIEAKTDPLERQYSYSYDSESTNGVNWTYGNLLSVSCSNCISGGITTSFTYEPTFNQQASITDPLGHVWTLNYDNLGNLTSIVDPLTHQVTLGHNSAGQVTSIADALNDTTQFAYSYYGDLSQVTDPLGNSTKLSTDNAGRLILFSDPLGNTTGATYDNLDHVTQIVDARNGTTSGSYDGNGNLLSVTDANGNQTSYIYDSRNRVTSRTDGLRVSESYGWDANGNLTSHTDRRGEVTVFQYDALNRIKFAGFGQSGSQYQDAINYAWDGGNRLTGVTDSIAGTITRVPDLLDRLTSETTPQGTISYSYDNANRRQTMQVAGQPQVVYSWDNANRLTGITQGSSAVGINYDNANRRTSLTLPNGVTVGYSVDNDSRITGLTYSAGSMQLGNLTYGYDADGRVTSKNGTLAAIALPTSVSGNTFNADNGMTAFGGASLSYDANGNLTNDGTNTYTWDARNHLTAISGAATASFTYDAFGRRVSKTIAGASTQFLYDIFNSVQEIQAGAPSANLLNGLNIDEYLTRTDSSNNVSTLLTDALGSTIGLVGSAQSVATSYTYQPFGATTVGGAANGSRYQFAGHESDGTELYYYRSRYYSPTFQRFIAQDPIGFRGGDINLYSYVKNNPVSLNDLLGLSYLVYVPSGSSTTPGTIYIFDSSGNLVGEFPAANNTMPGYPPFQQATYPYLWHNDHPENTWSYGSNGDFVFDPSGLAVHSGHNDNVLARTNGCIRTTDAGTGAISDINRTDPLQTITVTSPDAVTPPHYP